MAEKDQDEMLRGAALARGFRLVKSRRRKAGGDFGKYGLADLTTGRECMGYGEEGLTASADEVLAYLRGGEMASWKRSLLGVVDGGKAPAKEKAAPAAPDRREIVTPRPSGKARKGAEGRNSTIGRAGTAGGGSSSRDGGPKASAPSPQPPPPPPAPPLVEVEIRSATRRDAAALAKFLEIPAATMADRLAAALRADEPPLIAEREGIVGVAAWTIISSLREGARGRITLLEVAKAARREGIGARLLAEVEERLAEAGVAEVELDVGIDFDAPTGFLRRTGFRRATNGYVKELGGS